MTRTPVSSSNVSSVGYDEKKRVLEIEFTNKQVYQYQDVSPVSHKALLAAPSKGQYVHMNIRGKYAFARVE